MAKKKRRKKKFKSSFKFKTDDELKKDIKKLPKISFLGETPK